MHTVASSWDAIELWLVGLPFAAQVSIVMAVVLPLCALAARVLDRVVGVASTLVGSGRRPALPAHQPDRADEVG